MDTTKTPVAPVRPDPIRELKNARRTLLQVVANIDAAIAAADSDQDPKESTRPER